ncbi:MAG: ferritin-like domain-containing protein [Brevinematia bacterium]
MNLNAVELFKIAQQIEQKGINFYRKAKDFSNEESEKELFNKLEKMEIEHLKFFTLMERKAKNYSYCGSDDVDRYIKEHFNPSFFSEDDSRKIGKELKTTENILNYAIEREKDSIEFYLFLSKNVSGVDENSMAAIRTIIREEESHIEMLKGFSS